MGAFFIEWSDQGHSSTVHRTAVHYDWLEQSSSCSRHDSISSSPINIPKTFFGIISWSYWILNVHNFFQLYCSSFFYRTYIQNFRSLFPNFYWFPELVIELIGGSGEFQRVHTVSNSSWIVRFVFLAEHFELTNVFSPIFICCAWQLIVLLIIVDD